MSPVYAPIHRSLVAEEPNGDFGFLELSSPGQTTTAVKDIPTGEVLTIRAPGLGAPRFLALSPGQQLMVVEVANGLRRTNVHRGRTMPYVRYAHPDLLHACTVRSVVSGWTPVQRSETSADWATTMAMARAAASAGSRGGRRHTRRDCRW
ncbi:hypothetical protein ACIRL0_11955 [Streptomyces sp. NPDC102365]|uniref:hypothetical protein n=1 Tax=Streptomyces sp. NPDC102365 TaxID=3366162 RepID=UPI0038082BB1